MHIPRSTYRIQFVPTFGFSSAKDIVPYLSSLGISDLYASPIFAAKKGSLHGYDVVNPNVLNPELGSTKDFENLSASIKDHGMFWLQDIVPNHMAFDAQNFMLMDIFENAHLSPYTQYFDIEWNHLYENIRGRVVAPFLGKFYGEALEAGEIQLQYSEAGFSVNYYSLKFPLKIETYADILKEPFSNKDSAGVFTDFELLSKHRSSTDRLTAVKLIKDKLWSLYAGNADIKSALDEEIKLINGEKGKSESYQKLEGILSKQLFRLTFWKYATEELNYRRFFTVNDLISVRVENPEVREKTHALIFDLVKSQKFNGLRIDHIDGLYDPKKYLEFIKENSGGTYTVVEKILQADEQLPDNWQVEGTSGYEYIYYINSLFCKEDSLRSMSSIYAWFTRFSETFAKLVIDKKRLILGRHMVGDVDNLAQLLKKISGRFRYSTDITIYGLKRALVELMAVFPVYRTYINAENFTDLDKNILKKAIEKARSSAPGFMYEFNFIEQFLLLQYPDYLSAEEKNQWLHFLMRFQQFTGPLMAKGFEDTLLYVYNRLISLNEVGGDPNHFGISVDKFHEFNRIRFERWPHSLNASSTHDTKRSEDVRARINVLSEIPTEWEKHLRRWKIYNRRFKRLVGGLSAPSDNDEYFLYQTLIGAFPFDSQNNLKEFLGRIKEYIIKAIREAKVHTAWLKPDLEYENACLAFAEDILSGNETNRFLEDFIPFQKTIAEAGIYNSLSTTLIKMTSPGVPDFYQGCELLDFSLVDPDNRRPVDFSQRMALLKNIQDQYPKGAPALIENLFEKKEDGSLKMFLIWKSLDLRNRFPEIFQSGMYQPLTVSGKFKNNIIAFMRSFKDMRLIVVAPRFLSEVMVDKNGLKDNIWEDTSVELPGHVIEWKSILTDETLNISGSVSCNIIFKHFPGSLLLHA